MRVALAVCIVIAGLGCAQAQTQTPTVPPPTPLPSTLPSARAYYSCLMNCDTKNGMCQGQCSVGNAPTTTFPSASTTAAAAGTRPDSGALSQCFSSCTNQQLACKQACPQH
jgi:hypothetical protein